MKQYLGDDQNAIDEVLLIFKKDTEENLSQLQTAIDKFDIELLNKTTHRMLPMFRQLEVQNAIPALETFEVLKKDELTSVQLKRKYQEFNAIAKDLVNYLSKDLPTSLNHNS